jgi:hypothetical protein
MISGLSGGRIALGRVTDDTEGRLVSSDLDFLDAVEVIYKIVFRNRV